MESVVRCSAGRRDVVEARRNNLNDGPRRSVTVTRRSWSRCSHVYIATSAQLWDFPFKLRIHTGNYCRTAVHLNCAPMTRIKLFSGVGKADLASDLCVTSD